MSQQFHGLKVSSITAETAEAVVVSFEVPVAIAAKFEFVAGQYLTLRASIDGVDLRRSYSICSPVGLQPLSVGIRQVPSGVFSSWVNNDLRVGDVVQVFEPQGRFSLPDEPVSKRHVVAIAGGAGITPILSIASSLLAAEPGSSFALIYANRTQASTMFKVALDDLKDRYVTRFSVHNVLSRERSDSPLCDGRLDSERLSLFLRTVTPADRIDHAFVCGPGDFNDLVEGALTSAGLCDAQIHIERFGVPTGTVVARTAADVDTTATVHLVVIRDGRRHDLGPVSRALSVLEAASAAGLDVPYSCRAGVCTTCRAKLVDGVVHMERNFALDRNDVAAGFVLTCQSHPRSASVTVSFDER